MKYSAKVVAMAPRAAARMMLGPPQPYRNAGNFPQASRRYTYGPPLRGTAAASSATVSAPHSANTPPATHTSMIPVTLGTRSAIAAGDRNVPDAMTEPTGIAIADQRPMVRGSSAVAPRVEFMATYGSAKPHGRRVPSLP